MISKPHASRFQVESVFFFQIAVSPVFSMHSVNMYYVIYIYIHIYNIYIYICIVYVYYTKLISTI